MTVYPQITLSSIAVSFDSRVVLENISFTLAAQSRVAIMGPSGSGKSSLLKVMAGLVNASSGEVTSSGKIGYLPQDSKDILLPWMRVHEHVSDAVAHKLELVDQISQFPRSLSGGQLRRLAIGYVFSREKEIYLLDEPLTGLDIDLRRKTVAFINDIASKNQAAIAFITHYEEDIRYLNADYTLIVQNTNVSATHDLTRLGELV